MRDQMTVDRRLAVASWALLAAFVLHDLDHLRQGRSVEAPVTGIGILGDLSAIALVVLAMRGSRLAPPGAVLLGFGTVLGFVLVHAIPDWGPLSDGYPGLPVDGLSWSLAFVPMAAAIWLAATGAKALRAASA